MVAGFVLGALLLAAAVALLADASLRLAAWLGAEGAQRIVAAAPFATAGAVLSSLGAGLLGLGGSQVALLVAAALLWLAARRAPRAAIRLTPSLGPPAAAALGVALAWTAWLGIHPGLGVDTLTYHLTESVLWVQDGHVGTVRDLLDGFPVGNYPVTNEVLVAWALGLAQSLSPAMLAMPLAALLFAIATVSGLRALGATPVAAGLAAASILLIPVAASLQIGPHTDLPALAWLVCAGALVAYDRPRLLVPALLAGALAVGTKTTTAPLGALVLAYGLWRHRAALPLRALLATAAVGVIVGGTWYIRNAIGHGWPLWPFAQGPWGDPLPPLLALIDHSFIERPEFTLRGRTEIYFDVLGGALIVLAAGLMAWLPERRRLVLALSGAALLAALIWVNAPFTGRADDPRVDFSITTVRYLFPALTAAAAALALSGRRWAVGALAVAVAVSVYKAFELPYPLTPSPQVVVAGALGGLLAVPLLRRTPPAAWLGALALFVAAFAPDFPDRHARTAINLSTSPLLGWFAEREDEAPAAFTFQIPSVAAGDSLSRELRFIPRDEPCSRVRARLEDSWVIGYDVTDPSIRDPLDCVAGLTPAYRELGWVAYRPQ